MKYRNELKFICSEAACRVLECRIKGIMRQDPHVGHDGTYRIRTLYFDDRNDSAYYENENGIRKREKFRIRIYNGDASNITLECKEKINGLNHKYQTALAEWQFKQILSPEQFSPEDITDPLIQQLYKEQCTRMLKPKVIVDYVRTPYVYPDGNVRITFDKNLSASNDIVSFLKKDIPLVPVMPQGVCILEVKYDDFLPHFIYEIMQTGRLRQTTFSKYYICRSFYKNHLILEDYTHGCY